MADAVHEAFSSTDVTTAPRPERYVEDVEHVVLQAFSVPLIEQGAAPFHILRGLGPWLRQEAAARVHDRADRSTPPSVIPELEGYFLDAYSVWMQVFEFQPGGTPWSPADIADFLMRDALADVDVAFGHAAAGAAIDRDTGRMVILLVMARALERLHTLPRVLEGVQPRVADASTIVTPGGGTGLDRDAAFLAVVEAHVFAYTNAYRQAQGIPPLRADSLLDVAARGHGVDMARRAFFDHLTPEGVGPHQRMQAVIQGQRVTMSSENLLFFGHAAQHVAREPRAVARSMVDAWIHSPGHRANLEHAGVTHLGVGVVLDAEHDRLYATQNFAAFGP